MLISNKLHSFRNFYIQIYTYLSELLPADWLLYEKRCVFDATALSTRPFHIQSNCRHFMFIIIHFYAAESNHIHWQL